MAGQHAQVPSDVDVGRTTDWMEVSERFLETLGPLQMALLSQNRVLLREIQALKDSNQKVLELTLRLETKIDGVRRQKTVSLAAPSEPGSFIETETLDDTDNAADIEQLGDIYARYITERKKRPRVSRAKGTDEDTTEFFYRYVPGALEHTDDEPVESVVAWQAAGLPRQRALYIKLGKKYNERKKTSRKTSDGTSRSKQALRKQPAEELFLSSSQTSDRALRAQRRQELHEMSQSYETD